MQRNGCWWILYLPAIGLLLLVLPQARGHYTFYPPTLLINVMGLAAWLYIIWRGMAWLESKMSRDVDAYTITSKFQDIHEDVATPLETHTDEADLMEDIYGDHRNFVEGDDDD